MTDVILWTNDGGAVVAYTPPGGMTTEEAIKSDAVPQDRPVVVKDNATLPKVTLEAWVLSSGAVGVDQAKVSEVSRRSMPALDNWKGKAILVKRGLYDKAVAAIAGVPDPIQRQMIEFAFASAPFTRNSPLLNALLKGIGQSDADIDQLFTDADGFTLSWTKTSTPTGTATFSVLCLK